MTHIVEDGSASVFAEYQRQTGANGVRREALKSLPVIDIGPFVRESTLEERQHVARKLREVCINLGFFYITGHGIPETEMDAVLDWGHRFFGLPTAEKMKMHQSLSPGKQGYVSVGGVDPYGKSVVEPDIKERFAMSRERLPDEPPGPSFNTGEAVWPSPGVLPGFEAAMKEHMLKRCELARRLVRAVAMSLDLPENFFDAMYRHMGGTLMYNYYPPSGSVPMKATQWNFSPHTDYGVVTLLLQDALGGLEARNADEEWIPVPPVPGTFVVNLGDTLQMWTNDLYVSTLHRVVNTSNKARISQPLFTYPHGKTLIECLPTCHGPGNPPKYEPVICEVYNQALVDQAARTGRPGLSKQTAARFKS
jgi:isopenicillin N synthase-like dioxygenase